MQLVLLDRDGVINQDQGNGITSPDQWHPIPGALEAIARLNQSGFRVVVTTNQPAIARGKLDLFALNAIHQKMHNAARHVGAEIDAIFFCPHAPEDNCNCRKPKPGMLHEIAARFDISLKGCHAIGDALHDLQSAYLAGCIAHLVETGKGKHTIVKGGLPPGTLIHADLAEAVEHVLNHAPHAIV